MNPCSLVTPRPWRMDEYEQLPPAIIAGDEGYPVVECVEGDFAPKRADLEHIVKCVNMHDELVLLLEDCREFILRNDDQDDEELGMSRRISAMLDVVKGGQP
jgi:hypothetical protein